MKKIILFFILIIFQMLPTAFALTRGLKHISITDNIKDIVIHPDGNTAYVSCPDNSLVAFVDISTQHPIFNIENILILPGMNAQPEPTKLAFNSSNKDLYVLDTSQGRLFIYDTTNTNPQEEISIDINPKKDIYVGGYPENMFVSPDNQMIYVFSNSFHDDNYQYDHPVVAVIDLKWNWISVVVPLPQVIIPKGIVIANDRLFVGCWDTGKVFIIDIDNQSPTKNTVVHTFQLSKGISDMIATNDNQHVYVSVETINSNIYAITPSDLTFDEITMRYPPDTSNNPKALALVEDVLYVINNSETASIVTIIDTETNQQLMPEEIFSAGYDGAESVAVSKDAAELYIANSRSGRVVIMEKLRVSIPSNISCHLSQKTIPLGKSIIISGIITPAHGEIGSFVGIKIKELKSDKWTISKTTLSNDFGEFSYKLDCDVIHTAGKWVVQTSWAGNDVYRGAESEEQSLTIVKGSTRITLDVTSQDIKLHDQVSISGKFTPIPECGDYSNIPINIIISGSGVLDIQQVSTHDKFGHFVLENYNSFTSLGDWIIKASFNEDNRYQSSTSEQIPMKVVETAGYAIIVQGKFGNEEGILSHNKTCNAVYRNLKLKGLLDDDIKYFNYTINQFDEEVAVDDIPSKTAIREAVTQWAAQKMNDKAANLYIIMIDHGIKDKFFIHPDEILSSDLSEWTDTLQENLMGQSRNQEIIFVLGFCFSGSFIDDLSGPNRVIITSAGPNEYSFKGPMDIDNIREGEYFVSEFFKEVALGKSVKQSFIKAVSLTEIFTANAHKFVNAPYYDISDQHPLLDDNSDGIGSNEIFDLDGNTDGNLSDHLYIGVNTSTPNSGNVYITSVSDAIYLTNDQQTTDELWARVSDDTRLKTLWIEVKQPVYQIEGSETGQKEMNLPKIVCNKYNSNTKRYECGNLLWQEKKLCTDPGIYQVLFFAKDDETDEISPVMETKVYKNKTNNLPPENFSILLPEDNTTVVPTLSESKDNYLIFLTWEESIDPDEDKISYTLMISQEDPLFSYTHTNRIEDINDDFYLYPLSLDTTKWNAKAIYWKVLAFDQYGAIRESGTNRFMVRDGNASEGWIRGRIIDRSTQQRITSDVSASISGSGQYQRINRRGEFNISLKLGTYEIEINAKGYRPIKSTIHITEGIMKNELFELEREVNVDRIILVLQIMADYSIQTSLSELIEDINDDQEIGLAEAINIMQQLSNH
jgi:DNA-binding beta-propeller fold protein YncE